jgi:hypothetical protein
MKTENDYPKVGDVIYVPSALYVFRGSDDFQGGKATVSRVEFNFVNIVERPNHGYNWDLLRDEQEKLKERFGDNVAHPDPDDRPEFNDENEGWH